MADSDLGLRIFDIGDPDHLSQVAGFPEGAGRDIILRDDKGYLLTANRVVICDISDLNHLEEIGRFSPSASFTDLALIENYAYLTSRYIGHGLYIVDLTNEPDYALVSQCPVIDKTYGLEVVPGFALLACGSEGVRVIGTENPFEPEEVGWCGSMGHVYGVTVSDHYLYQALGEAGLQIYDIEQPENPILIGACDLETYAGLVAVNETTAYISDFRGGIILVDISDRVNPTEITRWNDFSVYSDIDFLDRYVIIAVKGEGIYIIDASDPTQPEQIGSLPIETSGSYHFDLVGNILFLVDNRNNYLNTIDLSDPSDPIQRNNVSASRYSRGLDVKTTGSYAFVSFHRGGIIVFDISDPFDPVEIALVPYLSTVNINSLIIQNDRLFVEADGVKVLNITDPEHPFEVGYYDIDRTTCGLGVYEQYAFIPAGQTLYCLDCGRAVDVPGERKKDDSRLQSEMLQIHPNPFNSEAKVSHNLPRQTYVFLELLNISGQRIKLLYDGDKKAGEYIDTIQSTDLPSGLYFVRLVTSEKMQTHKVMLIR